MCEISHGGVFMEETNVNEAQGGAVSGGFIAWLDNFWYHYKWHFLISVFVALVIAVCCVQTCQRVEYDIYILYAGNDEIGRTSKDGDLSEFATLGASLKYATKDFDGNGEISVSFIALFTPSNKELEAMDSADIYYNPSLVKQDTERLHETMLYSSYYVCFLSPAVYEQYRSLGDVRMFHDLSSYDNGKLEYLDEGAVYLGSTGFASLPGFADLPSDTVVCMRSLSAVASHLNKKDNEEAFRRSFEVLEKILNYGS